ncbi:hypothetical protein [Burkholderia sp. BCC1988]|uniref:hypothetical protein n=1 Tax=Burkholderia sp. BCC1988 TaxID=2817443 RepID=UPI002AAF37AF|nr:hypothetical protein [Burkholderia sp. BCC1988]
MPLERFRDLDEAAAQPRVRVLPSLYLQQTRGASALRAGFELFSLRWKPTETFETGILKTLGRYL